ASQIDVRAAIERRLATLREQHARTQSPQVVEPPTPTGNGGGTAAGGPDENGAQAGSPIGARPIVDEAVPRRSTAPYFVAGGGVAIAAAGGVFGYLASAKEDGARAAPIQEDAARLLDDARRNAQIANVLFIAGG